MWAMTEDANFADGEIERFYNETFIAKKTENSIPFGTSIFKNLLLRNTDTFLSKKDIMLSLLGRKNNADSKLLNALISGMEAQIKSGFLTSLYTKMVLIFTVCLLEKCQWQNVLITLSMKY